MMYERSFSGMHGDWHHVKLLLHLKPLRLWIR